MTAVNRRDFVFFVTVVVFIVSFLLLSDRSRFWLLPVYCFSVFLEAQVKSRLALEDALEHVVVNSADFFNHFNGSL